MWPRQPASRPRRARRSQFIIQTRSTKGLRRRPKSEPRQEVVPRGPRNLRESEARAAFTRRRRRSGSFHWMRIGEPKEVAGTTTKTVTEQSDVRTHRRAREATIAHNDPPVTALLRQAGNRATRIALGARVPVLQRKCACGGGNGSPCECDEEKARESIRIQPKLLPSEPGDAYEQEADRVAEA